MRLIDADDLKDLRDRYIRGEIYFDDDCDLVDKCPTADAEVVVRCKDCKHSWEDIGGLCCSHGVCVDLNVPGDFYCAYGERKDGGEK